MRVLVEILRWKDENLKHENIQHFGFSLSKVAKMELKGEHTELKLNVKKKAPEGQNRLCHKHPLIDNKFGYLWNLSCCSIFNNHSANNE